MEEELEIDYVALFKNVREALEENECGTLRINKTTYDEFVKRRLISKNIIQDGTDGSVLDHIVIIDDSVEMGVCQIYV